MNKNILRRNSRAVSVEEDALFRETLKDAKPLGAPRKVKHTKPDKSFSFEQRLSVPKPIEQTPAKKAPPQSDRAIPAQIGGHREAHLRRGKLDPEARFDLHGLTQDEAYRALHRFLMQARDSGFALVLVVTGKSGVLRQQVPHWLSQSEIRSFVVGTMPAHIRHGGGGALYVALKRKSKR